MAKKKQWKQQIRAEVAAAMQRNQPAAPASPQRVSSGGTAIASQPASPSAHPPPAAGVSSETLRDLPLIRKDLARIGVVTGLLFVLLVGLTATDRRTDVLGRAYRRISSAVSGAVNQSPAGSGSGTSPTASSPTQ